MDPVATGLTILDTVKKGVKVAKQLYNAPKELDELQVEIATFTSVLKGIVADAYDVSQASNAVNIAIKSTQDCLLEIEQLIHYELVKDVPEGTKARRTAWLRKVGQVHELQETLGNCRNTLILAFEGDSAATARRSEVKLQELQCLVQDRSDDLGKSLQAYTHNQQAGQDVVINRLDEIYGQRWDIYKSLLEAQKKQYDQFESKLSQLLGSVPTKTLTPPAERKLLSFQDTWDNIDGTSQLPYPQTILSNDSEHGTRVEPGHVRVKDTLRLGTMKLPAREALDTIFDHDDWRTLMHSARDGAGVPELPKRVLRVDFSGQHTATVHLHESVTGERADYTALSYTWGGPPQMITTFANLIERKQEIPWHVIPPLFQDVMRLTSAIGCAYVWIDALCIVQDSATDWDANARVMDQVYGNATLTIVASSSEDAKSPLLTAEVRDTLAYGDDLSQNKVSSGDTTSTARQVGSVHELPLRQLESSRWSSRAWTFQERFLSPRNLYFVGGSAYFESARGYAPVATDTPGPLIFQPHSDQSLRRLCELQRLAGLTSTEVLETWWQLVEEYSPRQLSFATDKLIAVSGMARRFAGQLGPYAAGLWLQTDFVYSLAWRLNSTGTRDTTAAPSWSWASMMEGVARPPKLSRSLAQLAHHDIRPMGQNKLGAIEYGGIVLKGAGITACLMSVEVEGGQYLLQLQGSKGTLCVEADSAQVPVVSTELTLLRLAEDPEGNVVCLVLADVKGNQHWERVAVTHLYRRRGEHHWFRDVADAEYTLV
ncbi:hypothetical protein LTR17_003913 [Elasticomyces elasticus]|nr:hypothetical protein LTR17_003913 [Elasticomyces elasticus]